MNTKIKKINLDKEALKVLRAYIGDSFMSEPITNIKFAYNAHFEMSKHVAKIMRLKRNPQNQELKIAFRQIENVVNHLLRRRDKRENVRRAMKLKYYYTRFDGDSATTITATYKDLVEKFNRVKVEIINIGGIYNQIIDLTFKVNSVSCDIMNSYSYIERY